MNLLRAFALFAGVLFAQSGLAQGMDCDLSVPPEGPIVVDVGIMVLDVFQLSDVNQEYTADFVGITRWQDPRLAACPAVRSGNLWQPVTAITNRRLRAVIGDPRIQINGTEVRRTQRFTGQLTVPLDLRQFPFDRQLLVVEAVLLPDGTTMELRPAPDLSGLQPGSSLAGWSLGESGVRAATREILDGAPLQTIRYELAASRNTGYFVWKVILPMVVILLMSWGVYWIPANSFSTQVSIATTSVLTMFAYQLALSSLLPKVAYMTRMDHFSLGAVILVLFNFIAVLTAGKLTAHEHESLAEKVSMIGRWVYAAALVSLLAYSFVL